METSLKEKLCNYLTRYEKEEHEFVSYGTAGFRGQASKIAHLFDKVGIISSFICLYERANIGLMITASHNHHQDNGIKIINKKGEMLGLEWEQAVEKFCNTKEATSCLSQLEELIEKFSIDLTKCEGQILIGYDTRESSMGFADLIESSLKESSLKDLVQTHRYGLQTTPIMHFLVANSNSGSNLKQLSEPKAYYEKILGGIGQTFDSRRECQLYKTNQLVVDCSNGVGAAAMEIFNKQLVDRDLFGGEPIRLINTSDRAELLNEKCGADFVKTNKIAPLEVDEEDLSRRYVSLDGDADRLVYFYLEKDGHSGLKLKLLDGDKIMSLFGLYLQEMLRKYHLDGDLTLGFVQTAYANGASTDYLTKELGVKVDVAETGVKNLHKSALAYDLGVYFEANGHGTIWVSQKAADKIRSRSCDSLITLLELLNNFTGDAISDVFIVESILYHFDWDIRRWDKLYQDRANSLIKVEVKDRAAVQTTNAGQTCVKPEGLQAKIDELVQSFGDGARSFVRPSGTENVLRVYAEARDQDLANRLATLVGAISEEFCDKL